MTRLSLVIGGAAMCLLLGAHSGSAQGNSITDTWIVPERDALVEIGPCGRDLCGHIVWFERTDEMGDGPVRDVNNPDATLKRRTICGLPLLHGFSQENDTTWVDGNIYNPRNGKTYSSRMELLDDGRLKVRGFIGLPLFGRSQYWTRSDRGDRCDVEG